MITSSMNDYMIFCPKEFACHIDAHFKIATSYTLTHWADWMQEAHLNFVYRRIKEGTQMGS